MKIKITDGEKSVEITDENYAGDTCATAHEWAREAGEIAVDLMKGARAYSPEFEKWLEELRRDGPNSIAGVRAMKMYGKEAGLRDVPGAAGGVLMLSAEHVQDLTRRAKWLEGALKELDLGTTEGAHLKHYGRSFSDAVLKAIGVRAVTSPFEG